MNCYHAPSLQVGRYMVSPFAKQTESGEFAASVSIRSGHGAGSLDRVWRYLPLFESGADACSFALAQALVELQDAGAPEPGHVEPQADPWPQASSTQAS